MFTLLNLMKLARISTLKLRVAAREHGTQIFGIETLEGFQNCSGLRQKSCALYKRREFWRIPLRKMRTSDFERPARLAT